MNTPVTGSPYVGGWKIVTYSRKKKQFVVLLCCNFTFDLAVRGDYPF